MSNSLNLPEDRTPSVLNKETVWKAVKRSYLQSVASPVHKDPFAEAEIDDSLESLTEEDKNYVMETTKMIKLEFRQILKIENLDRLASLTRLYLDNNFIEKISGLDSLVHLVWLDLSFNRIANIEGLDALKKLQVFSISANQLESIGNLHGLERLSVLRIGNNRLKSKDDIVYLRKLPSLRTLCVGGNPFCDDPEWLSFVKAMLPGLIYLECKEVLPQEKERAAVKHQGDIFRAEGREEEERHAFEKRKVRIQAEKRHRAAFVETVRGPVLIKNLFSGSRNQIAEAELVSKIFTSRYLNDTGPLSLKQQFEGELLALANKIHQLGLDELDTRENEIQTFENSLEQAREEAQAKGVIAVEKFLSRKEEIITTLSDLAVEIEEKEGGETMEDLRREALKIRHEFKSMAKETWNQVMFHEVTLVTQTEQVMALFEESLQILIDGFLDRVRSIFLQIRQIDVKYFKSLSVIGEGIESAAFERECQPENELSEKSCNVLSKIALCHDAHQEFLLEEEVALRAAVEKWAQEYLKNFRRKEMDRHRARVLELNHFLDTTRLEEEELKVIVPVHEVDDEDEQ